MAGSTELSAARSAGDVEGLTDEDEVLHDAYSIWQKILDLQDRIKKVEAFDEDIQSLPLLKMEIKDQKQQIEGIGCSLPLLTERVARLEENLGGMYQKAMDVEEYLKTIGKLEKQTLQNMEMQLKLSTVMEKLEHGNMALKVKIKELEGQSEIDKAN